MPLLDLNQPGQLNNYGRDLFQELRLALRTGFFSWNSLEIAPETSVVTPSPPSSGPEWQHGWI